MKLTELLRGIEVQSMPSYEVEITGITKDSRNVEEGYLFFVTPSNRAYIREAVMRGASVFASSEPLNLDRPVLLLKDVEASFGRVASAFYGRPSEYLTVIGVTGTNGKTTTTFLLESIFSKARRKVGVIGTIEHRYNNLRLKATNTTPGAEALQALLSDMVRRGVQLVAMEVSSHALDQGRVEGVEFDCAIFTNITHDHLDYHGTEENYRNAKRLLFHRYLPMSKKEKKFAVLNLDDPSFEHFVPPSLPTYFYSTSKSADAFLEGVNESLEATEIAMNLRGRRICLRSRLIGTFNIQNILCASLCASLLGAKDEAVKGGIEEVCFVPGRLERIENKRGLHVFVDYAHTPDALKKVLEILGRLKEKRLILVFGCGGERDRLKRPAMGKIASLLADFVIVTSDNPRREDPRRIIEEIERGFRRRNYIVIEDRREAIAEAIRIAREGDIVLVAGKGHEEYQILSDRSIPFSDREVIKEILDVEA